MQRCHTSVRALGYDDKTGLVVIAGDGANLGSSSSSGGTSAAAAAATADAFIGGRAGSSASRQQALPAADAFAAEGVSVSAWLLQDQQLSLKFALGKRQVGCGDGWSSYSKMPLDQCLMRDGHTVTVTRDQHGTCGQGVQCTAVWGAWTAYIDAVGMGRNAAATALLV